MKILYIVETSIGQFGPKHESDMKVFQHFVGGEFISVSYERISSARVVAGMHDYKIVIHEKDEL